MDRRPAGARRPRWRSSALGAVAAVAAGFLVLSGAFVVRSEVVPTASAGLTIEAVMVASVDAAGAETTPTDAPVDDEALALDPRSEADAAGAPGESVRGAHAVVTDSRAVAEVHVAAVQHPSLAARWAPGAEHDPAIRQARPTRCDRAGASLIHRLCMLRR